MSRQRVAVGRPQDVDVLRAFPRRTVARNRNLYRVCRIEHGPWWFDSSMAGRFDLPHPDGTCYLAFDDIGALREAVGPGVTGGLVSEEWARARVVRRLKPPSTLRVADLTGAEAARFGVTLEINTVIPYTLPQARATRLHQAGHGGVRYRLRHLPDGRPGLALFGPSGERKRWPPGKATSITGRLAKRFETDTGIRIAPRPAEQQVRIIE